MVRRADGKVELYQSFIDPHWEIWKLAEKCSSESNIYPMNSVLVLSFFFPEKCVTSFWLENQFFSLESHLLKAALSMLQHTNSPGMRAILLSGLKVFSVSMREQTCHVPKIIFLFLKNSCNLWNSTLVVVED